MRSTDFTVPAPDRDFWGGADRFQRVLAEEILPLVETTYAADAKRRIVFGQSLGGQFVLFTAQTRPDLFWGHIASNPALHRNLSFFLDPIPATPGTGSARLFVSSSSLDDARFRDPALEWMKVWSDREARPWRLETRTLDGHSHFSAAPAAFRQGMIWLFQQE
jgi:predicted alpha/beta superfamily hydrolase